MIDYGWKVKLRRLDESDLETLFESRNEPEIYKWCRQSAPLHWKNHTEWFDWQRKDPNTEMFGIVHGTLAGACGLTSIDKTNGRAEFSLYISPMHQGEGLGEAGLKTLFKWGFDTLRLNRIWGETFQDNPAQGLFTRLGMEKEGVRREYYYRCGDYIDATLFSIGASSFNALHGSKARYGGGLKPVA